MNLEHIRRSQHYVEALEAGEAAGVVLEDDVGPDPLVTGPPDRDRVEGDGQARVGDGWHARHNRLRNVFALEGRREVANAIGS